jgi:hypothetical protein
LRRGFVEAYDARDLECHVVDQPLKPWTQAHAAARLPLTAVFI